MNRFLAGLGAGAASAGVTYAITTSPPWWWVVGLAVAVLIWSGEVVLAALID